MEKVKKLILENNLKRTAFGIEYKQVLCAFIKVNKSSIFDIMYVTYMKNKKVAVIIFVAFLLVGGFVFANQSFNKDQRNIAYNIISNVNPSNSSEIGSTSDDDPQECKPPNMPLTLNDASEVLGEKLRMLSHKPFKYDSVDYEGYECNYYGFNPEKHRELRVVFYYDAANDWSRVVGPKSYSKKIEGIGEEAYSLIPDSQILVKKGDRFVEINIKTSKDISDSENEAFLKELAKRAVSKM